MVQERRYGGGGSKKRENAMDEKADEVFSWEFTGQKFPNEIREEHGMLEMLGDIVTN